MIKYLSRFSALSAQQEPLTRMSNPSEQKQLDVNFMPFSISYNGPAPISKYMQVADNGGKLSSHFRGREIKGEVITLPNSITGALVSKPSVTDTTVHVLGTFQEVKLWEHDIAPNTSLVNDLFDWSDIAQSVCMHFVFPDSVVQFLCT